VRGPQKYPSLLFPFIPFYSLLEDGLGELAKLSLYAFVSWKPDFCGACFDGGQALLQWLSIMPHSAAP